MNILTTGRLMGKTFKLIKGASESGGYILTRTSKEAARIMKYAEVMKVEIKFPITIAEFDAFTMNIRDAKEYKIEDMDRFLAITFPHHRDRLAAMGIKPEKVRVETHKEVVKAEVE